MQKLVWQNANGDILDLTSGNYGITEWEGFSNTSLNIQTQSVPFQDGAVFLDALIEQRELSITLAMQDKNNLELRYQQRRELISALNPKLGEGYLIYTNDYISKRIKCIPQIPLFETHNSDTVGTPKASLSWTACSPYWEDLEETQTEIESGELKAIINVGDIPCQIKAKIPYISNNPVLYNRTNEKKIALNGISEKTIEINTNIGQKEVLGIDNIFNWVSGGVINDCVYGNGKYVYVGTNIIVEDYFQGTRKTVDSGIISTLIAVAYGNNKYVIGGQDGQIITSIDGENWELQQTIAGGINALIYGNGKFVAVGGNGVYISEDGISWTKTYTGTDYYDVVYSEEKELFVVCGRTSNIKSVDGENWVSITITTPIYSVCYGAGIFMAINNYYSSGQYYSRVYTSTDGTTWTQMGETYNMMVDKVVYGEGKYIMGGGLNIYTSTDGTIWEVQENVTEGTIKNIVYENRKFVIVGNGGSILKSLDGLNWETIISGVNFYIFDIIYANNKYIAVGSSGNIATSTDGKVWQLQDSGTTKYLYSISYGNNTFVAVGESGIVLTSSDGTEWVTRTSGFSGQISSIAFGNGKFVAVAGTGGMRYSEDGITWQNVTNGGFFDGVCYGGSKFVAVGRSGYTGTSEDGITWEKHNNNISCERVFYGNGLYIAVGLEGTLYISEDGITWNNKSLNTNKSINKGAYGEGGFVVVGDTITAISTDGNSWVLRTTPYNLRSVIYENGRFVSGGVTGIITELAIGGTENLITKLSNDSDMTFNLEVGENEIYYEDINGRPVYITYRQEYIGV